MNQLTSEIKELVNTTEFNTQKTIEWWCADVTRLLRLLEWFKCTCQFNRWNRNSTTLTLADAKVAFAAVNATATNDDGKNFSITMVEEN
jgi:hypothetical protein